MSPRFVNFPSRLRSWFSGSVGLLVTCTLLLGLVQLSVLPPWEGMDEEAHFAYLQQLADSGKVPRHGSARLSRDVEVYRALGPMPYSSIPPFEDNGGLTYRRFFAAPRMVERGRDALRSVPPAPRRYAPADGHNWQAQHPPLYYLLLSPLYLASKGLAWVDQVWLLRAVSYGLAFAGLLIALGTTSAVASYIHVSGVSLRFGLALWPYLFPQWFFEMARIGNDSLIAFLVAVAWALLVRYVTKGEPRTTAVALGIALGLACLTKALALPVAAGLCVFLAVRALCCGAERAVPRLIDLALIATSVAAIAGWWYLGGFLRHGSLVGADQFIMLGREGGLIGNIHDGERFSIFAVLRGMATMVATFSWVGSWSLSRPPHVLFGPLAALVFLICACYLFGLRWRAPTSLGWVPLYLAAAVLGGLGYHMLIRIALVGFGGTGGWYLHTLIAPSGLAVGIALSVIVERRWLRWVFSGLLAYTCAFALVAGYLQVLLYTGCLSKEGAVKTYHWPEDLSCLGDLTILFERLSVVAHPTVALVALVLAVSLASRAAYMQFRSGRPLG